MTCILHLPLRPPWQSPWRTDCASDGECADYSELPKSEPSKRTLKNLGSPYRRVAETALVSEQDIATK